MALPKYKVSKSRRDKRRTHQKIQAPKLATCSNCGEMKMPHRVCPECGMYKERKLVAVE